jgi:hypothetical protein
MTKQTSGWRRCSVHAIALVVGACSGTSQRDDAGGEGGDAGPGESEPSSHGPLRRMTSIQYNNTVRDLFAPAQIPHIFLPYEIEATGGFENNAEVNSVTAPLVEGYQRGALGISEQMLPQLGEVLPCDVGQPDCAHSFLPTLAEHAWRHPLADDEREALLADFDSWAASYDDANALALSIQALLQAPDFIYVSRFAAPPDAGRDDGMLTSWQLASRMSYFLWGSMPDETLMELARADALQDREVVIEQAWRMLVDPRARKMVADMHRQLFELDAIGSNPLDFAHYTEPFEAYGFESGEDADEYYHYEYLPQLRFEPYVFVSQHVFEGEGTLSALLTANRVWATPETAALAYDLELTASGESVRWQAPVPGSLQSDGLTDSDGFADSAWTFDYYPIDLDPSQRSGLLTLAGWSSATAGPRQPSPVKRGVLVLERLLCTELAPPGDVPPLETSIEGKDPVTNREKYEIHEESPTCAGCHTQIDGIGLTFEHYDSMGRWRDTDNGVAVDASGELLGTDQDGPVADAVELSAALARSRSVHDCYARQWVRYALGHHEVEADEAFIEALQEGFWSSGGDILELIVNIAASRSFRGGGSDG